MTEVSLLMGDPRMTEHLGAPESPECGSLLGGGGGRAPAANAAPEVQ
jgi:hypothetical protein